jgi:hypothetical protein
MMSDFATFQTANSAIQDPELKKLVEHVTDMLKVSVYQAVYSRAQNKPMKYDKLKVGVKQSMEYDSVGKVVDDWIETREPSKIKAFEATADTRPIMARSVLIDAAMKRIDYKSDIYTSKQVAVKNTFGYINDHLIIDKIGGLFDIEPVHPLAANEVGLNLKLNLVKIKCVDETNPEWFGRDEIASGGVAINDKGVETKINEFFVGSFNDGGSKTYNPAKILKSFPLDSINPSSFMVLVALAEKDNGGFSTFLEKLYQAVKAELTAIIIGLGAAAGAAIGAAIGGTIGTTVAGPVGTVIGIVAGLILGAIVAWLVDAFRDDIFEPQLAGITLWANRRFTGPLQTLRYKDFGGTYTAQVYWSAA